MQPPIFTDIMCKDTVCCLSTPNSCTKVVDFHKIWQHVLTVILKTSNKYRSSRVSVYVQYNHECQPYLKSFLPEIHLPHFWSNFSHPVPYKANFKHFHPHPLQIFIYPFFFGVFYLYIENWNYPLICITIATDVTVSSSLDWLNK